jgi:3-dehydroquinate synthase
MSKKADNQSFKIPIITTQLELETELNTYPTENIFILVDENTAALLPNLIKTISKLQNASIIEIPSGEANKTIETCIDIWKTLSDNQVNKKGLLINLGGGVITDLGGFVASTFKRGIDFLNIPTTLLAMTDAAIGGKTGVDLDNFKNQIGIINSPVGIYYDSNFLSTLPKNELISGFAEVLKHGLVKSKSYWSKCTNISFDDLNWEEVILGSVEIKCGVVKRDPYEKGERRLLNFGHTIGHAIETFMMNQSAPILHGEAVAIGIICESYISTKMANLSKVELEEITSNISKLFPKIEMKKSTFSNLIELMKNDKKNISNEINFSLLDNIGSGIYNQSCSEEMIIESLSYYTER